MKSEKQETMTQKVETILSELAQEDVSLKQSVLMSQLDELVLQIKDQTYHLVLNYRDGFNFEAFEQRYQEYFDKFDFIVGDWGYEQLRLRGFYQVNEPKTPREQQIDYLEDYLKEYCNFGCQYFVLAKEGAVEAYYKQLTKKPLVSLEKSTKPRIKTTSNRSKKPEHKKAKPEFTKKTKQEPQPKKRPNKKNVEQGKFIIRHKGDK